MSPAKATVESKPVKSTPMAARTVPVSGCWKTLRPPAGGRQYLGLPHIRWWAAKGQWVVACAKDGTVYRIDLNAGDSEILAKLPVGDRNLTLAISEDGQHWALRAREDERGKTSPTWLDGELLEESIDSLEFAESGALLGYVGQELVRMDVATRKLTFRGGQRASMVAEANGKLLSAGSTRLDIIESDGSIHKLTADDQDIDKSLHQLFVAPGKAYSFVGDWNIGVETLIVWDLEDRSYEAVALRAPRQLTMVGDRVIWLGGEFDIATGNTESFEITPMGTRGVASFDPPEVIALSPDASELSVLHLRSSSIRRFSRATRKELNAKDMAFTDHINDICVSNRGQVGLARDTSWLLLDGKTKQDIFLKDMSAFYETVAIAFSTAGDRIAVAESSTPSVTIYSTEDLSVIAKAKMIAYSLAFSEDDSRLLVCDESKTLLCDGQSLETQHALAGKLRRAHWSQGKIVAHDTEGYLSLPPTFGNTAGNQQASRAEEEERDAARCPCN